MDNECNTALGTETDMLDDARGKQDRYTTKDDGRAGEKGKQKCKVEGR